MNSMDYKSALALLLSSSGSDGSFLATRLASKFGSFYDIVNADEEELSAIKGMNKSKLNTIKALPNILEAYLKSKIITSSSEINTYKDVMKYFKLTMRDLKFELFSYALFDIKKRVIEVDSLFRGSISSATIYPRDIIDIALSKKASYIVVCHNHPGGSAKPSDEDIILTEGLHKICSKIELVLIDHIIIAQDKKYSFRKKGLIDFFEKSNLNNNNKANGVDYA